MNQSDCILPSALRVADEDLAKMAELAVARAQSARQVTELSAEQTRQVSGGALVLRPPIIYGGYPIGVLAGSVSKLPGSAAGPQLAM